MKTLDGKDLELVLRLAADLRANPELGFKEVKSSGIIRSYWERIGLKVESFGTGLKAYIEGKGVGPTVALIGELDSVVSPDNPMAVPNGNAHACGHYIQSSQVFGAACILSKIKDSLSGNVAVFAVPAEEFIEIAQRMEMKKEGKIRYLSGKPDLMAKGAFDDVDMAMMIHAQPNTPEYSIFLNGGNLGFVAVNIRFIGKTAHGAEPFEGRNALQATMLFLNGINANRETFRDDESIRIHPIVTKGGNVVNSVPDDCRIETYVRGSTREAIEKGYRIVERCASAAAEMMGCGYRLERIPGYLPLNQDRNLSQVMKEAAEELFGEGCTVEGVPSVGSTDFGDLSHLIPAIQPTMGGFDGDLHSACFRVLDEKKSILKGSELLAATVEKLLSDNAERAKEIIGRFNRKMDREEYFNYLDSIKEKGEEYVE